MAKCIATTPSGGKCVRDAGHKGLHLFEFGPVILGESQMRNVKVIKGASFAFDLKDVKWTAHWQVEDAQ